MADAADLQHAVPFEHVVDLYAEPDELVGRVAGYLGDALAGADAAIVVATRAHREAFAHAIRERGIDVDAARQSLRLIELDAEQTLQRISTADGIDRTAFATVIGGLVARLASDGRRVRAYGEMVALLWADGLIAEALDLETAWNQLAERTSFSLYCSYPHDVIAGADRIDELTAMCALHSDVRGAGAVAPRVGADRSATRVSKRRFDADHNAPFSARQFVRESLRGHVDAAVIDDATLVTTELVTNAILHAKSRCEVTVSVERAAVLIEVRDDDTRLPAPRWAAANALSGRGMTIIASVAHRWGSMQVGDGKSVWAELRPPG